MNQELDWVLDDFKQEFLLLVREERFEEEADVVYQKYKLVKEAMGENKTSPFTQAFPQ